MISPIATFRRHFISRSVSLSIANIVALACMMILLHMTAAEWID